MSTPTAIPLRISLRPLGRHTMLLACLAIGLCIATWNRNSNAPHANPTTPQQNPINPIQAAST